MRTITFSIISTITFSLFEAIEYLLTLLRKNSNVVTKETISNFRKLFIFLSGKKN
jgi:hypothetical protein